MITWHEVPDVITRNLVAAIGTITYAFTSIGPVAWVTMAWVLVQMAKFLVTWWREERARWKARADK